MVGTVHDRGGTGLVEQLRDLLGVEEDDRLDVALLHVQEPNLPQLALSLV